MNFVSRQNSYGRATRFSVGSSDLGIGDDEKDDIISIDDADKQPIFARIRLRNSNNSSALMDTSAANDWINVHHHNTHPWTRAQIAPGTAERIAFRHACHQRWPEMRYENMPSPQDIIAAKDDTFMHRALLDMDKLDKLGLVSKISFNDTADALAKLPSTRSGAKFFLRRSSQHGKTVDGVSVFVIAYNLATDPSKARQTRCMAVDGVGYVFPTKNIVKRNGVVVESDYGQVYSCLIDIIAATTEIRRDKIVPYLLSV
jgi:hypothetical protein